MIDTNGVSLAVVDRINFEHNSLHITGTINQERNQKHNGLNGQTIKELNFIHIPKTAGSSIENAAFAQNIKYSQYAMSRNNENTKRIYDHYINKTAHPNCTIHSPYHIPPRYFLQNFTYYDKSRYDLFCIVRNPFSRILSEYVYQNKKTINCSISKDEFNQNLTDLMDHCQKKICCQDFHLLPQYEYVYDSDGSQLCDHVLHFENLKNEFDALMMTYGLNISLLHDNHRQICDGINGNSLTVKNISSTNRKRIAEIYKNYFFYFNYST